MVGNKTAVQKSYWITISQQPDSKNVCQIGW
jgi:hypothetical protein